MVVPMVASGGNARRFAGVISSSLNIADAASLKSAVYVLTTWLSVKRTRRFWVVTGLARHVVGSTTDDPAVPGERMLDPAEMARILPRWADLFDEPFGDPSGVPTFLVSRVARESVKVALSADGGDELFSGYAHYGAMLGRLCERPAAIVSFLDAATLEIQALMAHPGMAPLIEPAQGQGHGVYAAHLQFTMAGDWALIVTAILADGHRLQARVDVPAVGDSGGG